MLAKGRCECAQGAARARIRQRGVEYNFGRRKCRKSKPFSNLDHANRRDAIGQRGDSQARGHGGDDSRHAATQEDLDPTHAGGIEGTGGDVADTA